MKISPEDEVFSYQINSIDTPLLWGLENTGKDFTVIIHESEMK